MEKNIARLRRAKTTRSHIRKLGVARLSVLRSGQHIYAQLFTADGSKVLASASTVQAEVMEGLTGSKNKEAAAKVGRTIAAKALAAMPDFDAARVAELRDALAKGELPFDAGRLAGLIQRFHAGRG